MPCGKRPLVKLWDKPRNLRVITPSRYEQNEASVKVHWKNVIKTLELSYKDDQFWESQANTVEDLVGPIIFHRIAKIFDLPVSTVTYEPKPELSATILPSEEFYLSTKSGIEIQTRPNFSMSDYGSMYEEEQESEETEVWTTSSMVTLTPSVEKKKSKMKTSSRLVTEPKSLTKLLSKTFSRCMSKSTSITCGSAKLRISRDILTRSLESNASSDDDLCVQFSVDASRHRFRPRTNPHFDMLYCNESETDMIKWESHYKQKAFEVSASDEFSKRAEILTKQIAKDFFDWWVGLGNVEFKSEIKKPEDIEALFQVWFDEHASRGLVLNPKIIPCVLKSIANFTSTKRASCQNALKRQIAYDIEAETNPAHVKAFGSSLPHKMKHIPPKNNTEKSWHTVQIPEDLRSMSYVWEDIQHLTSTKAFQLWLQKHPNLPMPPCLKNLNAPGDKKAAFVVPSDYLLKEKTSVTSAQELALPVSQFSLELKEVLSRLLNE